MGFFLHEIYGVFRRFTFPFFTNPCGEYVVNPNGGDEPFPGSTNGWGYTNNGWLVYFMENARSKMEDDN